MFRTRALLRTLSAATLFLVAAAAPLAAQDVVLNEFLAVGGSHLDEDGDASDWIEVHNRGASPVNLGGWHLTDDAADLDKWRFPSPTSLAPGAYLVVFASDKNRAVSGQELHANFRLSNDGEFLALVAPDGSTIVHGYSPRYPEQHEDISFGLAQSGGGVPLVAAGATARYRVPAAADGAGGAWRLPEHDDAAWASGPTGLGYGSGGGAPGGDEPTNLAPLGTATQSSEFGGGQFPADLALDENYGNFTHTGAGLNLPATWELDLGATYFLSSIVLYNRTGCCPSRLRDITVSVLAAPEGAVLFQSALLNPENALGGGGLGGPELLTVDLVAAAGAPVAGRIVRVVRTPDPDLSGTGGQGNTDEADVLSLAEVEVFGTQGAYGDLIATDVAGVMHGVNASLYVRIPFTMEDPAALESLRLKMRYEDGFAAWLNGTEVARRNAPAQLQWNSTATVKRPAAAATAAEDIDIGAHRGALRAGVNVLAVHALNVTAADTEFLLLPELEGTFPATAGGRYFKKPTPGAANSGDGLAGLVIDTKFSHNRGHYQAAFDLTISTETAGAEIRYTLNGSAPSATNGLVYTVPIRIDHTSTVRARAFKPGLEPTNIDTHTYLFVDDVPRQDVQATLAAGFPARWGATTPDYGMDPDVVGPNDRFGGVYAASIRDDLKSLPSLSIVLNIDDMFGARGIYTNSTSSGIAWERPASAELIHPDGSPGFQIDCGIRIQGGYFRQHGATLKHSLRLLFKDLYGPTKLRHPLLGRRAAQEFDTLTLRAGANDGYSWDAARLTEQYTRDEFGRNLQLATGNAASRGVFVHLYVNGIYWGLYNPAERPDHAFSASYYGGEKEDWDSVHDLGATNGDLAAWNAMIAATGAARTSLDAYQRLQGRNPDGSRNPALPHLLDVPNYIDYLVVNLWGGNWDWPWKNWWAGRDRTAASTGFKFYSWDFENTMGNNRDRSPLQKNALANDFSQAGQPHSNLKLNPEYRLHFADRVHRHLFNDGVLTPALLVPRYEELVAGAERAIVGESARWGDQHFNPPLTLREWETERDWILDSYLPQRTAVVLQQFRAAGLYPAVEAPRFLRHGGRVDPGFGVVALAPTGAIWCTVDGTDPRLPGGAVSPRAFQAGGGDPAILIAPGAAARLLVPADDSLGLDWTEADFADGAWTPGTTAIGFDTDGGLAAEITTDVQALFFERQSSLYLRIAFDVDPQLLPGGEQALALLNLKMKYDDGYVAYLNGTRVAARNAPGALLWNSRATISRPDAQATVFEAAALTDGLPLLRPGRNVLALHCLNVTATNTDFLVLPQLEGVQAGSAISIDATTTVRARALDGENWSALNEATFIVDTPLRITEIQYDPAPAKEGLPYDPDDFEFLELENIGAELLDLTGIRLEGGVRFDFSAGEIKTLPPGGLLVIVENRQAFALRFGEGVPVAGQYQGRLANEGDVITLRGAAGEAILDFEYERAWHPETQGSGPSLVIADYRRGPETWGEEASWGPSEFEHGSPGIDESAPAGGRQLPSDINADARLNLTDAVALLGHLFLGQARALPCESGALGDAANQALLDANGDGTVGISDPIWVLNHLFLGGAPPRLGTACAPIAGCPEGCQ